MLLRGGLYGGALVIGLPWAFSEVMIGTIRQPTHSPPPGYEEERLDSEGLKLRAWVARGETRRPAVVAVHGVGDTLESYLEVAAKLRRRGHSVLLLDLRGHGGSEGKHMTLGGREASDVRAGIEWLRGHALADAGVVLMGYSMGAVAVLRAGAERSDVKAVVAEAPFDDYRSSIAHHARLFYHLPAWVPLIPLSIAVAEWRAGFDADAVDAVAAARHLRAPLLAIADGDDARMPEPVVRRVFDAHPGPKRFWLCPGVGHVGAQLHADYWRVVLGFFEENGV
jgi:hypothetical protein